MSEPQNFEEVCNSYGGGVVAFCIMSVGKLFIFQNSPVISMTVRRSLVRDYLGANARRRAVSLTLSRTPHLARCGIVHMKRASVRMVSVGRAVGRLQVRSPHKRDSMGLLG